MQEKKVKIKIRGLCKSFGSKRVLENLDLDIYDEESLVIIGGSGSGKSVLVKCIIGLIRPEKGEIFINDVDVLKLGDEERVAFMDNFGLLFQAGALFDSLPVWENVAFGLIHRYKMSKKEARKISQEKLRSVGLGRDILDAFPSDLSGGMQKRVALARAIATGPEILFFDEPTAGLDPIMCHIIDELIKKSVKELGAVGVSITHDLESARRIADRIAMIYDGRIVWQGSPEEMNQSENPYVYQFIRGLQKGPIPVIV